MSTETYSITSDFTNTTVVEISQLKKEILAESGITTTLTRIDNTGDQVDIVFDSAISGGEKTILDNLVANYLNIIEVPVTYTTILNNVISTSVKTTTPKRVCTFIYEGSNSIGSIGKIVAIAYKSSTITDYTIKITDKTNNLTIAEETFTNDNEDAIEFASISNVPTTRAKIEISMKGSGNQKVYIESITFYLL